MEQALEKEIRPANEYAEIDTVVLEIIRIVQSYMTHVDQEKIRSEIWRAYVFARNAHE